MAGLGCGLGLPLGLALLVALYLLRKEREKHQLMYRFFEVMRLFMSTSGANPQTKIIILIS